MREWVAEHRDLVDALLAVALLVAGLVGVRLGTVPGEPDALVVRDLLVIALCLPLARRRCEPRVVLVLVTLAAAVRGSEQ